MLMKEANEEMVKTWKEIYLHNRHTLQANKKQGIEIIEYLNNRYPLIEIHHSEFEEIIQSTMEDNHFGLKYIDKKFNIKVYKIDTIDKGKELYVNQDEIFKGIPIIVGIECNSSYVYVEGSSVLYDEIMAYRGLDEEELDNYFLVAQYIMCKNKMLTNSD